MKKKSLKQESFYTVKSFAELLKVHPKTVWRGIKYGRIHAFRVGQGKTAAYRIPGSEAQRMGLFDLNQFIKEMKE
jgi:excisionase family DNA binding protein